MSKIKKEKQVKLIKQLLSPKVAKKKKEFLWQEIIAAIVSITETKTNEAEDILIDLIKFDGEIRLSSMSDIPGAMSPEDMLKSLAIETLSEWTGRKHIKAFESVYATTKSPVLAGVAKVHIKRLGGKL